MRSIQEIRRANGTPVEYVPTVRVPSAICAGFYSIPINEDDPDGLCEACWLESQDAR